RFAGLKEPQGVAYVPGPDLIAVANGGDGRVRFYAGADFSDRGEVSLADDADNVRLDAGSGQLIVGYGNGGLALIARGPATRRGSIPLAAHPESFQIDSRLRHAFVNVPDAHEIAVVDLASGREIGRWTVPAALQNFPLAIDASGGTVASVFRSPP